jgi:hypothetical protein
LGLPVAQGAQAEHNAEKANVVALRESLNEAIELHKGAEAELAKLREDYAKVARVAKEVERLRGYLARRFRVQITAGCNTSVLHRLPGLKRRVREILR